MSIATLIGGGLSALGVTEAVSEGGIWETDEDERARYREAVAEALGVDPSEVNLSNYEPLPSSLTDTGIWRSDDEEAAIQAEYVRRAKASAQGAPSMPSIPPAPQTPFPQPPGGVVGPQNNLPVPSPASAGIPANVLKYVQTVAATLTNYPLAAKWLARKFGFVTGSPQSDQMTECEAKILIRELPDDVAKPLAYFAAGLCAPIGLSKREQDIFLALQISESGWAEAICDCDCE